MGIYIKNIKIIYIFIKSYKNTYVNLAKYQQLISRQWKWFWIGHIFFIKEIRRFI